ncbi:hypothetical protein [Kordiimonas sp.]|uniref:hypothetical protein n=1 Tax=Kordiimonas sp. TaxID=1970157 RepID=UPI003A9041BF
MQIFSRFFTPFLLGFIALSSVSAQEAGNKDRLSLENLPTYDVPRNLFEAEEAGLAKLRTFTLDQWSRIRLTNHPLYHYVLAAAKFRAYINYCKRHDLNVDMAPINKLALMNLIEINSAQYEEPEWANFVGKEDNDTKRYLWDVSHDVYAFEFAAALADMGVSRTEIGATIQQYCLTIAKPNFEEYVGLLATAKRQLPVDKQ